MTTVCSFCNTTVRPGETRDAPVTHGICKTCYARFRSRHGIEINRYVALLDVPVLIVDNDVTVLDVNIPARQLAEKPESAILGSRAGTVYECRYSHLPGGCGRSVHCSGCAIRISVTETWETGRPVLRRPAVLRRGSAESGETIHFFVSTWKGENAVVLAIEPASAGT
jgi:hypothetical protein